MDGEAARAAIDWIRGIVAEPEVGVIYPGKVVKVVDFGAFVNFLGSRDGLVHISELAPHRVGKVADVVKLGDPVKVKVLGFDDRGKVKLSMRQVDQQTGEDLGARRSGTGTGAGGALTIGSTGQDRPVRPGTGGSRRARGRRDASARSAAPQRSVDVARLVSRMALPSVIGHRGAAACAPGEYTCRVAARRGNSAVAGSSSMSGLRLDRHLILLHDDRIERTTDGRGNAAALPLAALRRLRRRYLVRPTASRASGYPRWRDAVALLGAIGIGANVELKAVRGREAETGGGGCRDAVPLVAPHLPVPLISSFHPDALAAARCALRDRPRHPVPRGSKELARRCREPRLCGDPCRSPASASGNRGRDPQVRTIRCSRLHRQRSRASAHAARVGVTSVFSDVPHILAAAGVGNARL